MTAVVIFWECCRWCATRSWGQSRSCCSCIWKLQLRQHSKWSEQVMLWQLETKNVSCWLTRGVEVTSSHTTEDTVSCCAVLCLCQVTGHFCDPFVNCSVLIKGGQWTSFVMYLNQWYWFCHVSHVLVTPLSLCPQPVRCVWKWGNFSKMASHWYDLFSALAEVPVSFGCVRDSAKGDILDADHDLFHSWAVV